MSINVPLWHTMATATTLSDSSGFSRAFLHLTHTIASGAQDRKLLFSTSSVVARRSFSTLPSKTWSQLSPPTPHKGRDYTNYTVHRASFTSNTKGKTKSTCQNQWADTGKCPSPRTYTSQTPVTEVSVSSLHIQVAEGRTTSRIQILNSSHCQLYTYY